MNVMCKDTRIAILPLTYKYPIYKFKTFDRDIAGKQIAGDTFLNILWEPIPRGDGAWKRGLKSKLMI